MKSIRRPRISLVTETGVSSHKWWSTLKSAVFGTSLSLPPLVSEGGGLLCESVGKAYLLSYHFYSKLSREAVDLPLTCNPSLSLTTFAFRSREVSRRLGPIGYFGSKYPYGSKYPNTLMGPNTQIPLWLH